MTSEATTPLSRTAVAGGIIDPVAAARAELKAALAAIEEKANIPKRMARATEHTVAGARAFARRSPSLAVLAVAGVAAAVGGMVWGMVRLYTR